MGITIQQMESYYEYDPTKTCHEHPKQVLSLAEKSLLPILRVKMPKKLTHLIAATTCPDSIAPSLGQSITQKYHSVFGNCHVIDLVQGCAGGVSALILGSQLAELHKSSVIVVLSDAARKSTSQNSKMMKIFGNGSYACLITYENTAKGLMHNKSRQYKDLVDVVSIKLGHDASYVISQELDITKDPRKYLGISINNYLAIKLLRKAKSFFNEFIEESSLPDVIILHQVNPSIVRVLKSVFKPYHCKFVDTSKITGNCGTASIGIALHTIKQESQNKKIFLCSFGTGGVITAGLWQN